MTSRPTTPNMDYIAHQLAMRISEQLPTIADQLLHQGYDPAAVPWQLEFSLTTANDTLHSSSSRYVIAAINLAADLYPFLRSMAPFRGDYATHYEKAYCTPQLEYAMQTSSLGSASGSSREGSHPVQRPALGMSRPNKRRSAIHQQPATSSFTPPGSANSSFEVAQQRDGDSIKRRKRTFQNSVHQPSTLEKYISGVWESLYAGPKIDIIEAIEQWQAVESNGQPKLLTAVEQEVALRNKTDVCKCCSYPGVPDCSRATRLANLFPLQSGMVFANSDRQSNG